MASFVNLRQRLDEVADQIETSPGVAQEELETVTADLGPAIAGRQERARELLVQDDFPTASRLLVENALVLQRTANLSLQLREAVRRRR